MNKYDLLKELLPYIEAYEQRPNQQVVLSLAADFSIWLKSAVSEKIKVNDVRAGNEETEARNRSEDVQTTISKMLYMMYRYARHYTKKSVENSLLHGLDDFAILATLLTHTSLSKSDLVKMFVLDKTTGMQILNRLGRLGLIVQQESTVDKRSKKVSITDKGKAELFGVFINMGKTANIVTGNLDEGEKLELLRLLYKLDVFHSKLISDINAELIDDYATAAEAMRVKQTDK